MRAKETNIYEIKSRKLRSQIPTFVIFLVSLSKNHYFVKKQPFRRNAIVEEELYCIDIDEIENLEDSLRLVLIDEECGNLMSMIVNDGGEFTRNINQKKTSDVLQ